MDEDGRVVYLDSRTPLEQEQDETATEEDSSEEQELIDAIAVFPGAQRIHPAGENPELRKSFITRAPMDAVESFYNDFLAYGVAEPDSAQGEPENMVNSISSVDDNRRQTTLFVNPESGERGAMKVLLKEFPAQHAVQIVHTTLYATPSGLDPVGMYVTPEEIDDLVEQAEAEAEESEAGNSDDTASGEGD